MSEVLTKEHSPAIRASKRSSAMEMARELIRSEEVPLQTRTNMLLEGLGLKPSTKVNSSFETIVNAYFFLEDIGVSDINNVVDKLPQVLEYSVGHMQARVDFLKGLGIKNIGNIIERLPRLLKYNVSAMQARVDFLMKLGIKNIGKLVERTPQLLEYDLDLMQSSVDFLRSIGIENIGRIVRRQPRLLGRSVESMQRNVHYLMNVMHLTIEEIEHMPRLLCMPLDVIIARWEYLRKKAPNAYEKLEKIKVLCMADSEYIAAVKGLSADASITDYLSFANSVKSKAAVRT